MKKIIRKYEDLDLTPQESLDGMFERKWSLGKCLLVTFMWSVAVGVVIELAFILTQN